MKLTEAVFLCISLPHPLTLPVPSCTPVPLLLPAMSPGAWGSALAGWRHSGAATLNRAPSPVGALAFAQLGRPDIHLSQIQMPGFTFGLSLSHARKWTSGMGQEEGWGDMMGGWCEHTCYISYGNQVKRSFLLPGHYEKEMRNAVCDLVQEAKDICTVI